MKDGLPQYLGFEQKISFTGTSAQCTTAMHDNTRVMRLASTKHCFVKIGDNPTATTSDTFLPRNQPEYFAVPQTGSTKVAAIRAGASNDDDDDDDDNFGEGDGLGNGDLLITEFA